MKKLAQKQGSRFVGEGGGSFFRAPPGEPSYVPTKRGISGLRSALQG
jgi:hypothetical protein